MYYFSSSVSWFWLVNLEGHQPCFLFPSLVFSYSPSLLKVPGNEHGKMRQKSLEGNLESWRCDIVLFNPLVGKMYFLNPRLSCEVWTLNSSLQGLPLDMFPLFQGNVWAVYSGFNWCFPDHQNLTFWVTHTLMSLFDKHPLLSA